MEPKTPSPIDRGTELAETRTGLAGYRTQLALDRTMLAWIRTTLTMASFGFALVGFFYSIKKDNPNLETLRLQTGAVRFGLGLVILATAAMVMAGISQWMIVRKLRRGESPEITQWPLSITVAMLFGMLGMMGIWTLFFE